MKLKSLKVVFILQIKWNIDTLYVTFLWLSTALVLGERENMLGHGTDRTEGNLMLFCSNQEVQTASWWNWCKDCWWHVPKWNFPSCIPAIICSRAQIGYKRQTGQESWVISSLCTNPALWHSSHLALIPHLSEAKTCLVFDRKSLAKWNSCYMDGPCVTEQHQRHDLFSLL